MLNVSHINCSNGDNNYKSVTILSRPQSKCGQLSKSRGGPQESESIATNSCVQSISSVVATTLSLSMSSFASPSKTNGSQPLRSTVLANNNINNNNNNNNNNDTNCESKEGSMAEKSPMCRINEISRYNDIKHEYHLIEESGPAHNKLFTVVLKLGEIEEFRGSGPSIKKAQRNAATVALRETKLKQPAPRMHRHNKSVWPMTPTVELNVLAMKLGQTAVYHVYEPPRPQASTFSLGPIGATGTATNAYDFRGMHYQRYHVPRGPFCATLTVGSQQFVGKGHTAQAARHAAAEEALKVVRQLVNAQNPQCPPSTPSTTSTQLVPNDEKDSTQMIDSVDTNGLNADLYIKSPISLVHEMALKRNWSVNFEVIDESGPSHMPKFVTKCTVGHLVTTGEGNGKKVSKKNSALLMVEQLNKLEPLVIPDKNNCNDSPMDPTNKKAGLQTNRKKGFNRKKNNFNNNNNNNNNNNIKDNFKRLNNRNIGNDPIISNEINSVSNNSDICVKNNINVSNDNNIDINKCKHLTPELKSNCIQLSDGSDGAPIHPINRLIQLQQARKEKEPNFTLLSERIIDRRRREFTIECTINVTKGSNGPQTVSAVGLGATKKMAKKNAADQMLQLLGYSSRAPPQSILKQDSIDGQSSQHKKIRQVKFIEDNTNSTTMPSMIEINCGATHLPKMGRQLVPGLILMPKDISSNISLKSGNNFVQNNTNDSSDINSEMDWNCKSKTNESISSKIQLISNIAKEFLESKLVICHKKPEKEDINSQSSSVYTSNRSDQLKSLVENVGTHQLQVHFSDFPKKQSNSQSIEYLSVVTITTVWNQSPIVSHGSGHTVEEARNQASHQALVQLTLLEDS